MHYFRWGPLPEGKHRASFGVTSQVLAQSSQDKGDIPGGSKLQLGYYQVVVWMWSTRDSLRGLWSPFKPEKAPGSFSISSHPWVVVFPDGASRKEPACNAGDLRDAGLIPGLGRFPGGGNGNPLQDSCLENRTARGAWQATVAGVAHSWTWLSSWAPVLQEDTFSLCVLLLLSFGTAAFVPSWLVLPPYLLSGVHGVRLRGSQSEQGLKTCASPLLCP